ncbi:hypothetical protein AB0F81_44825 [Actinoplanes sp. NPDC024001]|uniref:(Fe-S)-binding protein n=1 Tax=Actinoplanes sp. NPDC024001 TaxID=3154598 RepID=UPI0033D088D7
MSAPLVENGLEWTIDDDSARAVIRPTAPTESVPVRNGTANGISAPRMPVVEADERVREVAGRVRQIEELLVEAVDAGRLRLNKSFSGRRILYHGHCHQKAEVDTAATVALLRRIPGASVTEVDAGCCGMAGSFGFESEHYEMSMAIGESRLFPAIRQEPAGTILAATGVSCRQQIRHGTQRVAWHPLELLRKAVADVAP